VKSGSRIEDRGSRRFLILALAALQAGPVAASNAAEPATTGGLLQAALGLALVLGVIVALAWMAKRFTPGALRGGMPLTIVASQAVGQRERVVVVEVAGQWLVLGVAPGRVNALTTLPKGELPTTSPVSASFASALSRALSRRD
jgi:flagellar protein FliO/FliZ